jgi:predicted GNAT superfamily acetyltransferase
MQTGAKQCMVSKWIALAHSRNPDNTSSTLDTDANYSNDWLDTEDHSMLVKNAIKSGKKSDKDAVGKAMDRAVEVSKGIFDWVVLCDEYEHSRIST